MLLVVRDMLVVNRDMLECSRRYFVGMSPKNMSFFFSFFQNCIYVYVGIYLDGI